MGRGRRDYTWGVLQDSILPGRYSVNFFRADAGVPEYLWYDDLCDYTVPAGYKLFLTAVNVSTFSPAINRVSVLKGDYIVVVGCYSMNYVFTPGNWGSYVYEAGERLRVRCYNNDPKVEPFYAQVMGVLEELV